MYNTVPRGFEVRDRGCLEDLPPSECRQLGVPQVLGGLGRGCTEDLPPVNVGSLVFLKFLEVLVEAV